MILFFSIKATNEDIMKIIPRTLILALFFCFQATDSTGCTLGPIGPGAIRSCKDEKQYLTDENCVKTVQLGYADGRPCFYNCTECAPGFKLFENAYCYPQEGRCDRVEIVGSAIVFLESLKNDCTKIKNPVCIPGDKCPANYYGRPTDYTKCQACPEHSTSPEGTTDKSGCKCNVGYYGDTGALNPECKKCPDNATTNQSGSMTIGECLCKAGYYGTLTDENSICMKCPANSTSTAGSKTIDDCQCNKGYYKNGASCERCPSIGNVYGTTETSGATSINQCYIPSNTSITDTIGTFNFVSVCNYE